MLAYFYTATVGAMRSETIVRLESELQTLAVAWNSGGPERLEQSLLERAFVRVRDFTYQFETGAGDIIIGDLPRMPVDTSTVLAEPQSVTFEIERARPGGDPNISTIEGRILRLGDGSILLVGIKMDERIMLVSRVTRAVATAAPIGIILALIGGYFSSRYAARRAEGLSRIAEAVMGGDLSQRADIGETGDEFDRLSERLNAMLTRLERLMASTRHAGEAIAHDLRSPLSRLRNRLEATMSLPLDKETAEDTLEQTIVEIDQLLATFNAILRLSRVNEASTAKFSMVNLSELAEEMAELFEPACEDSELSFSAQISPDIGICGDRALLAQAVSNILDNSIKYTPPGGEIALELSHGSDGLSIMVRDSGPGISMDDRDRVKQRFVRLDEARTQPGSGLGLALVDAVAELHHGKLVLGSSVQDDPGSGLLVTLKLP